MNSRLLFTLLSIILATFSPLANADSSNDIWEMEEFVSNFSCSSELPNQESNIELAITYNQLGNIIEAVTTSESGNTQWFDLEKFIFSNSTFVLLKDNTLYKYICKRQKD